MPTKKAKLIYVGDPMCSWCYGFSPEFSKAVGALKDEVEMELVMGGLRPDGQETMAELGDFLKHHWEEVAARSGQVFKYDLLSEKEFVYNTEPSCRAVTLMEQIVPDKKYMFFKKVQEAFYAKNENPHDVKTYVNILNDIGINAKTFEEKFNTKEAQQLVLGDFNRARQLGVNSFPTVLLEHNGNVQRINSGYAKAEEVVAKVRNILK